MSTQNTIQIIIEIKDALNSIKTMSTSINNFITAATSPISVKMDTTPITQGINEIQTQINNMAEAAEKSMTQRIGDIGFAITAIKSGISTAGGFFGPLIKSSNQQETATRSLSATLSTLGQATQKNIKAYSQFATEMQNLTNTGDEQVLSLLSLSTTMGIAESKRTSAVRGAIGLSKTFAAAGLSLETAMKGIALAYQGDFSQLQRYIPQLRDASTETEKMAILQEAMAQGFRVAESEMTTGAGSLLRLKNTFGDFKEIIGDIVTGFLSPIANTLADLISIINKAPDSVRVVATVIGGLTTIIALNTIAIKTGIATKIKDMIASQGVVVANATLTTSFKALTAAIWDSTKAMLASPYGWVVVGIGVLVYALSSFIHNIKNSKNATDDQNQALQDIGSTSTSVSKMLITNSQKLMAQYEDERNTLYDILEAEQERAEQEYAKTHDDEEWERGVAERNAWMEAESDKLKQKMVNQYASFLADLKRASEDGYKQIRQDTEEHLQQINDLLDAEQMTTAQHAEAKVLIERDKNARLRKMYYDDYHARMEIARQQVELGILKHEQYEAKVEEYFEWVKGKYTQDTREYLDAWRMKLDLTKQALADLEAMQKRFQSKEDALTDKYAKERELLEQTKAENEHYLDNMLALEKEYHSALKDLRNKAAQDEKTRQIAYYEDEIALAEQRARLVDKAYYDKMKESANAYVEWAKAKYGELSKEHMDALEKQKQAHETALIATENETLSFAEKWDKALDIVGEKFGAFADVAKGVMDGIASSVGSAFVDMLFEGKNFVKQMIEAFKNFAKIAVAEIMRIVVKLILLKALGGITWGGIGDAVTKVMASGGYVAGPGSGTSDSIPARLSNGEYVINARKTSIFRPLLDLINYSPLPSITRALNAYASKIQLPDMAFSTPHPPSSHHFANGGLVTGSALMPSATESRLESLEYLMSQVVNGLDKLNQKDYNITIQTKFKGVEFAREMQKANKEYNEALG